MPCRLSRIALSIVSAAVLFATTVSAEPPTSAPLAQQLSVTDIEVSEPINAGSGDDNPSSFWNGRTLRPIIMAPQPDGGSKVAWTDSNGLIHITPLDYQDQRCGQDVVISAGRLRDMVAHDDGSAVLVLHNGGMYLIRLRDGGEVFRTRLISNSSTDIHMGSLAWNGEHYAAYFAIHGGGHEGDALKFVGADGRLVNGGWNWGCSHSIDMRVVTVGKRFMPVALSDAYPGTGIYFHHNRKRVTYTWGDRSGGTGGRIGGLVSLGKKMFVAFSSKEGGRRNWSAALADFEQDAPYTQSVHKYLQDASVDQKNVKLARYGTDQLLVSWQEDGKNQRTFQRYDEQGQPVGDSELLPVLASPRADMQTDPWTGDVVWATTWGPERDRLRIMRIRAR